MVECAASGALPACGAPRPVRWRSEAIVEGDQPFGVGVIAAKGIGPLLDRGRLPSVAADFPGVRSICGDCRQCPLTADAR